LLNILQFPKLKDLIVHACGAPLPFAPSSPAPVDVFCRLLIQGWHFGTTIPPERYLIDGVVVVVVFVVDAIRCHPLPSDLIVSIYGRIESRESLSL
jgi:hypothetical protein